MDAGEGHAAFSAPMSSWAGSFCLITVAVRLSLDMSKVEMAETSARESMMCVGLCVARGVWVEAVCVGVGKAVVSV